jgi:phosphomannomutase/phosphoglucomutase
MTIFRGYDIRGVYGQDLTEEVATKVGKAFGTFLRGGETVCVGYDARLSSKALFKAFSEGLKSTGCKVIALGLVPNPVLYYYAWKNKIFGCLITASHNPKQWNGFKLVEPDGTSAVENIRRVEDVYDTGKFLEKDGVLIEEKNALVNYEKFLQKKLGKLEGKVAIDFFGGAGTQAAGIFKDFGIELIGLHEKPDGNFYGYERPEPKGENLESLIKEVKKRKAAFGVAFDGDADRSVFVDDKGRELNGSIMSSIFLEYILGKKKGKVIITADCASEIKKIVENHGGKIVWFRVGHGFIEKKCVEEKALFAGEQSSHFWFNDFYPFSDGILSTLQLAKILAEKKKKLSKLVDGLKLHPTEKLYINAGNDENKVKIIEDFKREFPNALDVMDGIKIELNDVEWVLIRTSQTLPEVNICAEGRNKKRLKEIVQKYEKIVNQKLKELA